MESKFCANCDGEGTIPSKAFIKWYRPSKEFQKEFNKSHPLKDCDRCAGKGTVFYEGGEKERFNILADRWEEETIHHSVIQMEHPCFIEMLKMKSESAVLWVIERMQKDITWLMVLLEFWIDEKDNPTTDEMAGKIIERTNAWIEWAKNKKEAKCKK